MADMYSTVAWAKTAADSKFSKIDISRNIAGDYDVTFDVKFCGICHSDVHIGTNDLSFNDQSSTNYPCVPGHELAGMVTRAEPGPRTELVYNINDALRCEAGLGVAI